MQGGDNYAVLSAGLPEISGKQTGVYGGTIDSNIGAVGALWFSGDSLAGGITTGEQSRRFLNFNASRSNAIYGKATTVQPPSFSLIPQIKY